MRRQAVTLLALVSFAGFAPAAPKLADPSPQEVDKIIRSFSENEAAFARARENYTYRQTAKLQEFDETGAPHGRFELVSDILFTPEGRRTERIVRAPAPSLELIIMSPEDEQDMRNIMPFVLTSKDIDKYNVRYLGRENADEIPCYVFAVKPKAMEAGTRYFTGEIWVDDRDLMIVKTYGRAIGILKKGTDQQFPKFETYRAQIDGKYWFPTFTLANSTLHFKDQQVKVRQSIKYEDYKQFKSDVKITYGGEEKNSTPAPTTPPNK